MPRFVFMISLLVAQLAFAQTSTAKQGETMKPLMIGDKIPNLVIGFNISTGKGLKLYDIKASLILLDFFSTACSGCIHDMKHLDTLQQKFSPRVKIISISNEQSQSLKRGLQRFKLLPSSITIVKEDSLFSRLFPHNGVPHHVWLDSSWHVRYITISNNATSQNFTSFLNGNKLPFVFKYELPGFDPAQPLWLEGGGRLYNNLQYYSYIMKKVQGFNANTVYRIGKRDKDMAGFTAINLSLLSLIKAAWEHYPLQTFENNNRVILEVKDSSVFTAPGDQNEFTAWLDKNGYCYELRVPYNKYNEMFSIMQQDILRFFNYDIRIEKRSRPCYVLVRTSEVDKIKSKGLNKLSRTTVKDSIVFMNGPLKNFILSLNTLNSNAEKPFIDGTGYTDNVDLLLGTWFTDIDKLKLELQKYDLDLIEEQRVIDMLVIRDKKEGSY